MNPLTWNRVKVAQDFSAYQFIGWLWFEVRGLTFQVDNTAGLAAVTGVQVSITNGSDVLWQQVQTINIGIGSSGVVGLAVNMPAIAGNGISSGPLPELTFANDCDFLIELIGGDANTIPENGIITFTGVRN
jgi:hypothetical protein